MSNKNNNNNKKKKKKTNKGRQGIMDEIQNVDDKALLKTILRDSPDEEESMEYIRLMTTEQARISVKHIYDSLMATVSDKTRQLHTLSSFAMKEYAGGLAVEPYLLQKLIDGNDKLRNKIATSLKLRWVGDDNLKKKYRKAKKNLKKEDIHKHCHGCGAPAPPNKGLKTCSSCRSVSYCSRECQVKDWKDGGHKKECQSLRNHLKSKTQPSKPDAVTSVINIPWICLAIPPSITGFDKEVKLHLPKWDFDDEKRIRDIRRDMNTKMVMILQNIKMFFKLELSNGQTDVETVGDMCIDAFMLHVLGYKDIRVLSLEEVQNENNFSETYFHYTKVPKGWCIPLEDRPYISADILAGLEEGIDLVRKKMGEREAL